MRAKPLLLVVLAMVTISAAGCGGNDSAAIVNGKDQLAAALSDFELSAGQITAALTGGNNSDVAAQIKAAEPDLSAKWEIVVEVAVELGWPDKDEGDEAWSVTRKAIDSLPDTATVAEANAALASPMEGLMAVEAELWTLVQTTE